MTNNAKSDAVRKLTALRRQERPYLLLVEQDRLVRRRMARSLNKASTDIFVLQAGTVAEAIRHVDRFRPGTLLLGLTLPDGSGLEVLHQALAVDDGCMVIVLTDHATPATRLKCFEEGADFVFDKSNTFERALETARRASKRELARVSRKPLSRRVQVAELVLTNRSGLHALPAARLVRLTQRFQAALTISCNDRSADAKSILDVLALSAEYGTKVVVTAEGRDADIALAAIRSLVASKFHEKPVRRAPKRKPSKAAEAAPRVPGSPS